MTAFIFHTLFLALSCAYLLFLARIADGLKRIAAADAGRDAGAGIAPRVAVLLPARNEAATIERCLRSLAAQDYPAERLAVLVVDDASEDATADLALRAMDGDGRFRLLRHVPGAATGKKAALERGIAASSAELLLTTDADCTHAPGWVSALAAPLRRGADIAAGPVLYRDDHTLFARLQALEFLGIMGVSAGLFGIGAPRLCNGANLAYRRKAYERCGGFASQRAHPSGDDEFLLQDIAYTQGGSAAFTAAPDAVVRTSPAPSILAFLRQRRRWASKGRHYADRRYVAFLGVLFFYFLFAAAAPAAALLSLPSALLAAVLLAAKWAAEARVLRAASRLFGEPFRLRHFFAAVLFHPLYIVLVSLSSLGGSITWKNRKLATS